MDEHTNAPELLCLGLSYRTASVQQRELIAGRSDAWVERCLEACPGASEWVLLSTCNRIELYLAIPGLASEVLPAVLRCTANVMGSNQQEAEAILYTRIGLEAASHLLSVAAGLDSMVLGESQILGQTQTAFAHAVRRGSAGPTLSALFQTAIRTGKRVRAETILGRGAASVASVALELAESMLGDLCDKRVVVVGYGEMGRTLARLLASHSVRRVTIVNRSLNRAQIAASAHSGWAAVSLDGIQEALSNADLVLTATGALEPVITSQMLAFAANSRRPWGPKSQIPAGPLVVIDLGVPRDVAADSEGLDDVVIFDLDDIQRRVASALKRRESVSAKARQIVEEELDGLQSALRELTVRPLVVELRQRAEAIREQELERTLRRLGDVDPETQVHLEYLTRALVNKLLHQPTVHIKRIAREEASSERVAAARELFGLQSGEPVSQNRGGRA